MAIINSAGNISGFLAPYVVGVIVTTQVWNIQYYVLYLFADWLMFMKRDLWASGSRFFSEQPEFT